MVKKMGQERRKYPRAKRVVSIEFRVVQSKRKDVDKSWRISTTQDMSVGGIAFLTEFELAPGDIIEINVMMSGMLEIYQGLAKVLRVTKKKSAAFNLAAVKFSTKTSNHRRAKRHASRK